ncbi:MDS1 and EVI1 complex locus protein EVI1-like [Stylophora pistillata]|uniref:MDS1 and EVI1 complex locus protein EVI1-like n=1 Tax=Stylophora pistillata TaxID=50429 RepID=UPI000C04504E|nr:MDS1 and EVI1 complex locus protein EVI1-like [Stylophora pistillata]
MFDCPECGLSITQRSNFRRHVKSCSTSNHHIAFPYCTKTLARNDGLKRHIKPHHSNLLQSDQPQQATQGCIVLPWEKPFNCDKCKSRFKVEETLNHHNCQKKRHFKCKTCGKCFVRKAHRDDHAKNSHGRQRGGAFEKFNDEDYELPTRPSIEPDEEKKVLNGVRMDATFRPETKVQKKDF